MSVFSDYLNRNPITKTILVFLIASLFFLAMVAVFSFNGFEQGKVYGEVVNNHLKIYGGQSVGYEDVANVILSDGKKILVVCESPCIEGSNIRATHYITLTGKDLFVYDGT